MHALLFIYSRQKVSILNVMLYEQFLITNIFFKLGCLRTSTCTSKRHGHWTCVWGIFSIIFGHCIITISNDNRDPCRCRGRDGWRPDDCFRHRHQHRRSCDRKSTYYSTNIRCYFSKVFICSISFHCCLSLLSYLFDHQALITSTVI